MRRAPPPCSARARSSAGARRRTRRGAPDAAVPPSRPWRRSSSCIPTPRAARSRPPRAASSPIQPALHAQPSSFCRPQGYQGQRVGSFSPLQGSSPVALVAEIGGDAPYCVLPSHGHRRRETEGSARAAAAGTVGDPRRHPAARALRGGGRCLRAAEQGNAGRERQIRRGAGLLALRRRHQHADLPLPAAVLQPGLERLPVVHRQRQRRTVHAVVGDLLHARLGRAGPRPRRPHRPAPQPGRHREHLLRRPGQHRAGGRLHRPGEARAGLPGTDPALQGASRSTSTSRAPTSPTPPPTPAARPRSPRCRRSWRAKRSR